MTLYIKASLHHVQNFYHVSFVYYVHLKKGANNAFKKVDKPLIMLVDLNSNSRITHPRV